MEIKRATLTNDRKCIAGRRALLPTLVWSRGDALKALAIWCVNSVKITYFWGKICIIFTRENEQFCHRSSQNTNYYMEKFKKRRKIQVGLHLGQIGAKCVTFALILLCGRDHENIRKYVTFTLNAWMLAGPDPTRKTTLHQTPVICHVLLQKPKINPLQHVLRFLRPRGCFLAHQSLLFRWSVANWIHHLAAHIACPLLGHCL